MELYQALLELCENVKIDQSTERLQAAQKSTNVDKALEDYTRWVARTGASKKAILESHYNDLVARGRIKSRVSLLILMLDLQLNI